MGKLNTRWKTNTHFSRQILTYFRNKFLHFLSATFPLISNNKYSDFASALLTSEAKAHIFHQHHLFHKQTLIFSILTTLTTKKLPKNYSKFKYSNIRSQISPFFQYPNRTSNISIYPIDTTNYCIFNTKNTFFQ